MKKTIICFLMIFFMVGLGVEGGKKPLSLEELKCQLTPKEALEKAREMWNNEKGNVEQYWQETKKQYVKAEYDTIVGPYSVLSQQPGVNSGFLLYFVKGENIIGQAVIYSQQGIKDDEIGIFPKGTTKYSTLLLEPSAVEQKFKEKFPKAKEAVFVQMVFPARFWGPSFITALPAVWWVIDGTGNCFYVTLTGDIFSFSKLAGKIGQKVPGVIYDDSGGQRSTHEYKGGLIK